MPQVVPDHRRLYKLQKNSYGLARSVGARLQSCRNCSKMSVGFIDSAKEMSYSNRKDNCISFDSVPLKRDFAQDVNGHHLCRNQ